MDHTVRVALPDEKVRPFVEFFYEISVVAERGSPLPQKVYPCGHTMLLFMRNGYWRADDGCNTVDVSGGYISGQRDNHFLLQPFGAPTCFGIAFKPAAFRDLFQIDMNELSNNMYPLPDVMGKDGSAVTSQIIDAGTWQQQKEIVQAFIIRRASRKTRLPESDWIDLVLSVINQHHGDISVRRICRLFHCSERHLERVFSVHIGISPKRWITLVRFFNVMRYLKSQKLSPLELAAFLNYYDHSHFYKDFRRFTGENFSTWIKERHPLLSSLMDIDFIGAR